MREQESIVDACFIKKNAIPFAEGRILGSSFQYCFMQSTKLIIFHFKTSEHCLNTTLDPWLEGGAGSETRCIAV